MCRHGRRARYGSNAGRRREYRKAVDEKGTPSVKEAVGRGARWGVQEGVIVLLALLVFTAEKGKIRVAGPSRSVLAGVRRVAEKGFGRDALLFVGLLGSGLAALTHLVAGKSSLAMLFCLLGVLMCVGLW